MAGLASSGSGSAGGLSSGVSGVGDSTGIGSVATGWTGPFGKMVAGEGTVTPTAVEEGTFVDSVVRPPCPQSWGSLRSSSSGRAVDSVGDSATDPVTGSGGATVAGI